MPIKQGLYRHFKGNLYQVIDVARDSESQQAVVIYRALYGDKGVWVRPLSMFSEVVERDGVKHRRFEYLENQTVVLEVATLDIKADKETAFEQDFSTAEKIIASAQGYISHDIKRCRERTNRYILLVQWQTLEHHTVAFRDSELYQEWRVLLHKYFISSPLVEHYHVV